MDLTLKSTEELLDLLRSSEWIDPKDKFKARSPIRMELFRRGVDNINGVPLSVLLRNPLIKKEYEEATKGNGS